MNSRGREPRSCPVCAATSAAPLFYQRFAPIEGVSILDGYRVVTCGRCGMAYADDIPRQREFDNYYRDLSKYEYHQRAGEESEFDRVRMDIIANVVEPLIERKSARILDIGCATGRLLYLLAGRGFTHVLGVDPSPGCVEAAQRLYRVDVRRGHLGALPEFGQNFDVVILVGVLEHIEALGDAMKSVRSILTKGAIVYVEVPDALQFSRWPNAPFQDFSIEHINFFSPVSLSNLFAVHGLEPAFLEQNHRVQSHRTIMSNISAAFRYTDRTAMTILPDTESEAALRRYIEKCTIEEESVQARINELVASRTPILVWGTGTNAARLLTTTRLAEANITAFVDSNSKYHGKTLAGRPIVSPGSLSRKGEPIVVLSRVFQDEITRQIRETFADDRDVITLYETD